LKVDLRPSQLLGSATPRDWFASAVADLGALLSDHLHCERKAAENALALVRRYPQHPGLVGALTRLAHEETSHLVQVASVMEQRGIAPRRDTPNHYARQLLALVRPHDPQRLLDSLLVAAFIEARSHERLNLLADGFGETKDVELAGLYRSLGGAEERHARLFLELAAPLVTAADLASRVADLGKREAEIITALPVTSRIH